MYADPRSPAREERTALPGHSWRFGTRCSSPPPVENRARIARDNRERAGFHDEPLRLASALDEHDRDLRHDGATTPRVASQPVDVRALVAPPKRVNRVADPDAPSGQGDLLGEHVLRE